MKILLAVDGSEYTQKMLDYVSRNKALFDASHQYVLLHVHAPLPPHAASVVGSAATHDYYEDESRKVLEPALSALQGGGLTATSEWKHGRVGNTIGEYADQGGFDLLIMGSHGHGGLARLVMGSVANEVLAHCKTPVLLVR